LNRPIALAYGITGLAVAAALVAIIGSTAGLFGSRSDANVDVVSSQASSLSVAPKTTPVEVVTNVASNTPMAAAPIAEAAVPPPSSAAEEIVYVDVPAPTRRSDDDEHHGERQHHERDDERDDDDD